MNKIFESFITATWIATVVCLCLPVPGSSLKCHVCTSAHNETCADLMDDTFLVDCALINEQPDKNHTNCRKEIFSTYSKKFNMYTTRTIRSCGYEKHPKHSCFYSSNIDLKSSTCECIEDGCNVGTPQQKSLNTALIFVMTLILMSL